MYLLLVPPIAVAITLLLIASRRIAAERPSKSADAMEAHRRCLEALDPRAASRRAAQDALDDGSHLPTRHRHVRV